MAAEPNEATPLDELPFGSDAYAKAVVAAVRERNPQSSAVTEADVAHQAKIWNGYQFDRATQRAEQDLAREAMANHPASPADEPRNIFEAAYGREGSVKRDLYNFTNQKAAEGNVLPKTSEQQAKEHVDQLNSQPNEPAALQPDFDAAHFAQSLDLDPNDFANFGPANAEIALTEARNAVQEHLSSVPDSVVYEWFDSHGDDPLGIAPAVSVELGRALSPKYGAVGERDQAQQDAVANVVRLVTRLQMARTHANQPALPVGKAVKQIRLLDDATNFRPGDRKHKPQIVKPQNSYRNIHDLVAHMPR